MIVGVPTEVKDSEARVAMTPDGVRELASAGHEVLVQAGAGRGSSITDDEYAAAGARIVPTADDAWAAEMVVKVKEPQHAELGHLRSDLVLFTYLHLAAEPDVASALIAAGTTGVADVACSHTRTPCVHRPDPRHPAGPPAPGAVVHRAAEIVAGPREASSPGGRRRAPTAGSVPFERDSGLRPCRGSG